MLSVILCQRPPNLCIPVILSWGDCPVSGAQQSAHGYSPSNRPSRMTAATVLLKCPIPSPIQLILKAPKLHSNSVGWADGPTCLDCLSRITSLAAPHILRTWTGGYVGGTPFQVAHYASPSSGEAYSDQELTINFELWVEISCVPTCFHVRIPKPCLSVHREKKKSP